MRQLTNGLIFGLGLGLITMAAGNLTDDHRISAFILGTALTIAASSRVMKSLYRATGSA